MYLVEMNIIKHSVMDNKTVNTLTFLKLKTSAKAKKYILGVIFIIKILHYCKHSAITL